MCRCEKCICPMSNLKEISAELTAQYLSSPPPRAFSHSLSLAILLALPLSLPFSGSDNPKFMPHIHTSLNSTIINDTSMSNRRNVLLALFEFIIACVTFSVRRLVKSIFLNVVSPKIAFDNRVCWALYHWPFQAKIVCYIYIHHKWYITLV